MVCPDGSVNTSDQPSIAELPVFTIVMSVVNPLFQAFIVYVTRHGPLVPPELLDELLEELLELLDELLDEVLELLDELEPEPATR